MIPLDFISEWKKYTPWPQNYQIEQDLIICRALVEMFNHPLLSENLAELADEKSRDALIPLPGTWHDIERFGLMGAFWQSIARVFGYVEKEPRLLAMTT